jgi:hypothetical protein
MLLTSQDSRPDPEPDESSPRPHIQYFKCQFLILSPYYRFRLISGSQTSRSLQAFETNYANISHTDDRRESLI